YDILEQAGLQVYLVKARDTKNLPGRKSDVQESQWLMKLHTYGLLRNSFRPSQEVRTMRGLRTKLGAPIAIKAMAAKLARLVYRILRYGMKYVDQGPAFYDAQHRQLQIRHLKSKAAKLGFKVIEVPAA